MNSALKYIIIFYVISVVSNIFITKVVKCSSTPFLQKGMYIRFHDGQVDMIDILNGHCNYFPPDLYKLWPLLYVFPQFVFFHKKSKSEFSYDDVKSSLKTAGRGK